jgi:hypothetical protein
MTQMLPAVRSAARAPGGPDELLLRHAATRLFLAFWGSLVVVDATRAAGQVVGVAALAALAGVCSLHQPRLVAVSVALVSWLFLTGFVVNAYGDLTVRGPADLLRLVLLTAVATLVAVVSASVRRAT